MKKRIIAVLLSLLLVFGALHLIASADFGDYGGDYDYGGGDSYDWGGNDYDWDDDDDDDDDDGYYYAGGSGGSGGSTSSSGGSIMGGVILAAIIILVIYMSKKKGKGNAPIMPGAQATDPSTLRPMNEFQSIDPQFSEAAFREKLSNLYVQFQNAWQAKDLTPLRPYLTDAFYNKCDRQLDAYRTNKQTNRVERISVLGVDLVGWKQEADTDVMIARLRTRIVDYVVDDATGNIVRGSNTAEKFMEYEWDLVRTSGQTTDSGTGTTSQSCPHCGAPIDVNHTAVCEFCGSVLTTDTFDWAVREIKGLSQRTAG